MKYLELLAPARTAEIGIEAIRHGADAVYIGAGSFGARQSAGNSLEDIEKLVGYAHQYCCKVYVTVNTIIYEEELGEVATLIRQLYDIGVDALIVQDMAIQCLDLPPIPLHASTQMDNRSIEKVKFLADQGYEQVVLARELSLADIDDIHRHCPSTRLEVFVHGALCVSLSGRCYASEALFGRSANRGECAQVCRMQFNLEDSKGNVLVRDKHLLSLKDMCRIEDLESLAESGATSFKIEGRLKGMSYVKNVTAAYSQALDRLVEKYPDRYARSSKGQVSLSFTPDVHKSFNRGFTDYFLHGKNDNIFAFDSPKAIGKHVGRIKEVYTDSFVVDTGRDKDITFNNGDGICCFSNSGSLIGFRINRVEGKRLYPFKTSNKIKRGMRLYRNYDKQFEETLAGSSAERKIPVSMTLSHGPGTFTLTLNDGDTTLIRTFEYETELARTPQHDNIYRQLSKLGTSPLVLDKLSITYKENYFIPSSLLSQWRRAVVEDYINNADSDMRGQRTRIKKDCCEPFKEKPAKLLLDQQIFNRSSWLNSNDIGYQFNVSNSKSKEFYQSMGFESISPAFELNHEKKAVLMTCRHCIKYALGRCPVKQNSPDALKASEKLFLVMENGARLELEFNCKECWVSISSN